MNKFSSKALALWAALSAVVIIVGIVLFAVFGFNYAGAQVGKIDVTYDAIVRIEDKEDALRTLCEKVFEDEKVSFKKYSVSTEIDSNFLGETGGRILTYVFDSSVSAETLQKAAAAISTRVGADSNFANAEILTSAHAAASETFSTAAWRGGLAIGIAVVVALVYLGFRFGWGTALAGLIACANDTLLTFALIALARIPVYAYSPLLYAGIAAIVTIVLWTVQSMRMRENFKDPAFTALSAQEAVTESCKTSWKLVLFVVLPLAVAFIVLGAVATAGVRLFMLPALLPLAVSVYSSLLLAPAAYVPMKDKFDRLKSKRKRYVGKKKAGAEE